MDTLRAERDAALARAEKYKAEAHLLNKERDAAVGLCDQYVAALTTEREQVRRDVQPLQDIVPATAWGQNVCAWAAEHIAALTAELEVAKEFAASVAKPLSAQIVVLTADNERLRAACARLIGAIEALAVEKNSGPPVNWNAIDASQDAARTALAPRATP